MDRETNSVSPPDALDARKSRVGHRTGSQGNRCLPGTSTSCLLSFRRLSLAAQGDDDLGGVNVSADLRGGLYGILSGGHKLSRRARHLVLAGDRLHFLGVRPLHGLE